MTERNMFYGAKSEIFEAARILRDNMTEAEKVLWFSLQKNKILGLRFKSQHPIDKFIADFYCHRLKLVIEVDGEIHNNTKNKEYDIGREAEIEKFGIKVIRFSNKEVIENNKETIQKIIKLCSERLNEIQNLKSPL